MVWAFKWNPRNIFYWQWHKLFNFINRKQKKQSSVDEDGNDADADFNKEDKEEVWNASVSAVVTFFILLYFLCNQSFVPLLQRCVLTSIELTIVLSLLLSLCCFLFVISTLNKITLSKSYFLFPSSFLFWMIQKRPSKKNCRTMMTQAR